MGDMMRDIAGKVHDALAAVCPISGVSIGDETDRKTWVFTPDKTATVEQVAAAASALELFNLDADTKASQTQTIEQRLDDIAARLERLEKAKGG